jgi:hypothetical protein
MPEMMKPGPLIGLSSAVALSAVALGATLTYAKDAGGDAMMLLSGRWAGQGKMVPVTGEPETFKCVVTYIPVKDGTATVRQNLRCQSENYRLDTAALLTVDGKNVTGSWVDNVHALDGDVQGSMTKDGFNVMLTSKFFQARMAVASNGCDQQVRVEPARADVVREVSAQLKKC